MKAGGAEGGTVGPAGPGACPPCGDGNCEVEATSPTATQVEHDREACSSLGWSIMYPEL